MKTTVITITTTKQTYTGSLSICHQQQHSASIHSHALTTKHTHTVPYSLPHTPTTLIPSQTLPRQSTTSTFYLLIRQRHDLSEQCASLPPSTLTFPPCFSPTPSPNPPSLPLLFRSPSFPPSFQFFPVTPLPHFLAPFSPSPSTSPVKAPALQPSLSLPLFSIKPLTTAGWWWWCW